MKRFLVTLVALISVVTLVACSSEGDSFATSSSSGAFAEDSSMTQSAGSTAFAIGAPAPAVAPSAPKSESFDGNDGSFAGNGDLQFADRKVISTASISVEVEAAAGAVNQVRAIAEGLGGFIEALNTFGEIDHQRATVTVRVPPGGFFDALERIGALGKVQGQSVGSEDVSEQFIDIEARLTSAQREEASLIGLLDRVDSLGDIITIEREITRIRSEVERLQGQLNFLERRADLATIFVELFPPGEEPHEAPSLSATMAVQDVGVRLEEVKELIASFNGEVDRVAFTERDGKQSANVTIRVFTANFDAVVDGIESKGDIKSKELREGAGDAPPVTADDKPNARITLALVEKDETSTFELVAAIIGIIIVLGLIVGVPYGLYRYGHKRGSQGQAV